MTRVDPLPAYNAHVRAFAAAHRLRTSVRGDGEVCILLGPRKPVLSRLGIDGRSFPSDHHASYGYRSGLWTISVGPMTTRALHGVTRRWEELRLPMEVDAFEASIAVSEDRFFDVAELHSVTRPQRRRQLSPETARAAAERLASHRRGKAREHAERP